MPASTFRSASRSLTRHAFLPALGIALLGAVAIAATGEAHAQRAVPDSIGTNVYTLTAGPLTVQVGPTRGARIRSLKYDGVELFYQDSSGSPSSHGSSFWPSPQAHWTNNCRNANNNGCWPPPAALDGSGGTSTYSGALLAADTAVTYVSNLDNGTGIRLRKTLWANLGDTSIGIRYHIINGSANPVAFSGWEVTRFPSGGLLFWPRSESDTLRGNGNAGTTLMGMVRDTLGTKWFKYDSTSIPTSGTPKIWDGGTDGWFARVDKSRLLYVKRFTDTPSNKKAPVNENEIEIYTANRSGASGGMSLLEMELQGPYDTIPPGDSIAWDVNWIVRPLPAGMEIAHSTELLNFAKGVVEGPTNILAAQRPGTREGIALSPASNRVVRLALDRETSLSLDIVDARGKTVIRLHTGRLPQGNHSFRIPVDSRGIHWLVARDAAANVLAHRTVFLD